MTIIEALRVGRQVTGRSSAKITSQHSLIYRHLRDTFDLDTAQTYAEANRAGTTQIRTWVRELGIACDLEEKDAYAYTCKESLLAEIEAEAAIARKLGFTADVVVPAPLPFETAGALRFPGEAQFNPAQYLVGLAAAVKAAGGSIFENTRVHDVKPGRRWRVVTERGRIDAERSSWRPICRSQALATTTLRPDRADTLPWAFASIQQQPWRECLLGSIIPPIQYGWDATMKGPC